MAPNHLNTWSLGYWTYEYGYDSVKSCYGNLPNILFLFSAYYYWMMGNDVARLSIEYSAEERCDGYYVRLVQDVE